ncbi:hypothetical protein [Psychrobium sp. 1_MG-2023]|uniref:hypothetical protein n=1 Tax=Psychrobium sp. 1_MG-2023 TaxID=3062624 RepID=UPI000C33BDA3|nr:hypothetical protein [Psychrobium sp. 1_MG-2023]MDP2562477.1 hypothetical protein [Psychrobium sp. 1_MG-2023]PKF54311.1 hypothetical protein CW748_16410 [Alteromonadales bacterium alter-6D02]
MTLMNFCYKKSVFWLTAAMLTSGVASSVAFAQQQKDQLTGVTQPEVNICYERLSKAYLSLDPQKMVDVYTPDGHYISAGKHLPVMQGQNDLMQLYSRYFSRLKKHNSSLDLQFRVTNRLTGENTINDVGYYVVTIIPPKESKQPAKQHAGKFMITFKRQSDDSWGIWAEANSKAKIKSYINAKAVDNLHYDPYYPAQWYENYTTHE